jgi:hypothetical protein
MSDYVRDTYSESGAKRLAQTIEGFWLRRGYLGVRVWIEPIAGFFDDKHGKRKPMYRVASNISPFPPKAAEAIAA